MSGELKAFISSHKGKTIKIKAVSGTKAIKTASKIFKVKMNKVSVKQV